MKRSWPWWAVFNLMVGDLLVCHLVTAPAAIAQIVSDPTLPTPSDVVPTPDGVIINGGTVRGNNLFHSFDQFSVTTGTEAYFNNSAAIANIISRVTGSQASTINGSIRANGTANLFLLNPNGIVLGPNAQLNIGGSFLASTADRVLFANGVEFSASNPQAPPLLTVNAPIGLQYGTNPGAIRSQVGTNGRSAQLQVASGQMLGLLGGDLALTGVSLLAPQGRVELGSVGANGIVELAPTAAGLAANYGQVTQFRSIDLASQSSVNTSGPSSGAIHMRGDRIRLTQASSLISDTLGNGSAGRIEIEANQLSLTEGSVIASASFGGGKAADIAVIATDSLNVTGVLAEISILGLLTGQGRLFDRRSGIITATASPGNAGNITVESNQITLRNSAGIISDTFGSGNGGNVTVRTAGALNLSNNSVISSSTARPGNAGNIRLDVQSLQIKRGGGIIANSLGSGDGGDIFINASASVMVLDSIPGEPFPTSIVSATSFLGGSGFVSLGVGGDVTINTGRLIVRGGAVVSSSTGGFLINGTTAPPGGSAGNLTINATESVEVSGISADGQFPSLINSTSSSSGAAGRLQINTRRLTAQGGGQVSVSTTGIGSGPGGSLDVNADRILLSGQRERLVQSQGTIERRVSISGLRATAGDPFFSTFSDSVGGNIRVRANELVIQDKAELAVNSSQQANGGTLDVRANIIRLDTAGRITAATGSGQGGNVGLTAGSVLLRRGSQVSARAEGSGNGGNIQIDANFIVGLARENSDILASANQGNGGNINIGTQGIFGLVPSDRLTPFSDINASSEFGVDGVIEITTLDTDPSRGLVTLPTGVVDVSGLVAQDCSRRGTAIAREAGEFTISGRGGIPAAPTDMLAAEALFVDWESLPASDTELSATRLHSPIALPPSPTPPATIVEAQGWQMKPDGEVVLLSHASHATPHEAGVRLASCVDLTS
jgi:filamentous hemagglutinin family protein